MMAAGYVLSQRPVLRFTLVLFLVVVVYHDLSLWRVDSYEKKNRFKNQSVFCKLTIITTPGYVFIFLSRESDQSAITSSSSTFYCRPIKNKIYW